MDYKKNINVFSFCMVRHVELRLKVGCADLRTERK